MNKKAIAVMAAILTAGCSSISSVQNPKDGNSDGVTYYMPKRDFMASITVKDGKVASVTLAATAAYPDTSTQYVLRRGQNAVGKSTLDIKVNGRGLLTVGNSQATSNLADALNSIAGMVGPAKIGILSDSPVREDQECTVDGVHTMTFSPGESNTLCKVTVASELLSTTDNVKNANKSENTGHSGYFYRQELAYTVTASGQGLNASAILFSPTKSPVLFAPINKSLFSSNNANLAFEDGVLTAYKQESDSEIAAFLKLPAGIIQAYFTAIGSTFDSFKSNDTKEAEVLTASMKLELAQRQYAACIAAIEAGDSQLISSLECKK